MFCTHEKDERGIEIIKCLAGLGCLTKIVREGELADPLSVAFFTDIQNAIDYPSKYARMTPYVMNGIIPNWAVETPFKVALRNRQDEGFKIENLQNAGKEAARLYERFFADGMKGNPLVQDPLPDDVEGYEQWLAMIESLKKQVVPGTQWEKTPRLGRSRGRRVRRQRGEGWKVDRRKAVVPKEVSLAAEQRQRESLLIAALGAFNYDVGMDRVHLTDTRLHRIFQETIKRLAIVAEQARPGAGTLLFKLVSDIGTYTVFTDMVIDRLGLGESGISHQTAEFWEVSQDGFLKRLQDEMDYVAQDLPEYHQRLRDQVIRGEKVKMSFYPLVEAILTFGKEFSRLSLEKQQICLEYALTDESKHFSRIMDPDLICDNEKKVVGTADAGNPRILRLMSYGADHRKRKGVYKPWPIPGKLTVERGEYQGCVALHQRRNSPYIGAVCSASTPELAKNLIDIFRRLITQHPLEITIGMMEEWLMEGEPDLAASISAFQIHNDGEDIWVKAVGIGGGRVIIRGPNDEYIEETCFNKIGQKYGALEIGRIDFQHPIHQSLHKVKVGWVAEAIPATASDMTTFKKGNRKEVVRMRITHKIQPVELFEWTLDYVQGKLYPLVSAIQEINPQNVRVQFGHVHSDRDAGPEQETSGFMAREFAKMLGEIGLDIDLVEGMIDNYHTTDRINVSDYKKDLETFYGQKGVKVSFEASLLCRRLGDELIIRLMRSHPGQIQFIGSNCYLNVTSDIKIELYDGIGAGKNLPGRQGCVPFEGGFEIRRLNPALANKLFQEIIFRDHPDSLLAKWWHQNPEMDFEDLCAKYIYGERPEKRAAIKAQLDQEIDRPFNEKIIKGDTDFLDAILEQTDVSKQALLHLLEGTYDAQQQKFAAFMALAGVLPMHVFRVSFDRHSGRVALLDCNKSASELKLV